MWKEGDRKFIGKAQAQGARSPARQYAMFTTWRWQNDWQTYRRRPAEHQAMGYVSPYGGATQGHPFAFDYATGGTRLQKDRRHMLCFTFDLKMIRVYVDARLDVNGNSHPFVYTGPIYDGGESGAVFTVAQRDHPEWPTYPEGLPKYREGFDGRARGLRPRPDRRRDRRALSRHDEGVVLCGAHLAADRNPLGRGADSHGARQMVQ